MGIYRIVVFKFNKRIPMLCLLMAVWKVSGTFSQAYYCSGETSSIDVCLREIGVMRKNIPEMPANIEELNVACSDFNKGMKCLQEFAFACLEKTKREFFVLHFESAVYIMKQLCENNNLRQEYLKHPECHKQMGPEWDRCAKPVINLVHGENVNAKDHSEDKILKICSVKLCFLDCVNQVSRLKCVPEAADMYRDLASNLSGSSETQYNCTALVNSTICKDTNSRSHRNSSSFAQVMGLFLTFILVYSWRK